MGPFGRLYSADHSLCLQVPHEAEPPKAGGQGLAKRWVDAEMGRKTSIPVLSARRGLGKGIRPWPCSPEPSVQGQLPPCPRGGPQAWRMWEAARKWVDSPAQRLLQGGEGSCCHGNPGSEQLELLN